MHPRATVLAWSSAVVVAASGTIGTATLAQSPEMAMREFASTQVKKGVRPIGMGGDGATWGNYSLVYKDAGTALVDVGVTSFDGGNQLTFTAVGFTSPSLWHDLSLYAIALSQHATDLTTTLNAPLNGDAQLTHGSGADQGLFFKAAMPLGAGWSAGLLLSYELSQFDATGASTGVAVHYETQWRPSGGFGVTWQQTSRFLVGSRVILNSDAELRRDGTVETTGISHSFEWRVGGSALLWKGALVDVGSTRVARSSGLSGASSTILNPNFGFEQALLGGQLVLRTGHDETANTLGCTVRRGSLRADLAYVDGLGLARA
ncbi:MAG: hypothetical protein HY275_00100, partial [Gemmatimonadetes bacterium]|nr:hypothetical protein [Gemmatimonadota bacterium]